MQCCHAATVLIWLWRIFLVGIPQFETMLDLEEQAGSDHHHAEEGTAKSERPHFWRVTEDDATPKQN